MSVHTKTLGLMMILTACGSATPTTVPTQDTKPAKPPLLLQFDSSFPASIEFEQGYKQDFNISRTAKVEAPGVPVIKAANLPDGAEFNGRVLSWTPSCSVSANLVFKRGIAEHSVLFTLTNTLDKDSYVQRRVVFRVHQFLAGPGRVCGDPQWQGRRRTGTADIYFDHNFQELMPFIQGISATYDIASFVHDVAMKDLTFSLIGAPTEAVINAGQLTWAPPCNLNPNLFENQKMTRTLTIRAARKDDPSTFADAEAQLIVYRRKCS